MMHNSTLTPDDAPHGDVPGDDLSGLIPLDQAHIVARLPDVSRATLARWARELPIGAVRVAGRWYCDPARLRAAVLGRPQGGPRP